MADIKQNLLLELDALIDTRYGFIQCYFPEQFVKLGLAEYCKRNHNRMWELLDITKEEWETAWGNRTSHVLETSKPTNLLINLKMILLNRFVMGKTSPIHDQMEIHLNVYPYVFDEAGERELHDALMQWTFPDAVIKIVSISPYVLTPTNIRANYQALFLLDWVNWLTIHVEELKVTKMPTVVFNIPAYIIDNNPELLMYAERDDVDPFAQLVRYMAEFMTITFLKPDLFSLVMTRPS